MSRYLTLKDQVSIMPSMQQPLLTSDEVVKILKVSRSLAYLMMKRGDFPVIHVGSAIRVRPEDLESYIAGNATQSNPMLPTSVEKSKSAYGLQ